MGDTGMSLLKATIKWYSTYTIKGFCINRSKVDEVV